MIVVSDASPIIGLAAVDLLDLLHDLYGEVLIPTEVYREISVAGSHAPGVREIERADWIRVQAVQDASLIQALALELDTGEAEAIALSVEVEADLVLIDERRARAVAARFGRPVIGVIGVLTEAKLRGLISAVRPVLDALDLRAGFRISAALRARVLEAADEEH